MRFLSFAIFTIALSLVGHAEHRVLLQGGNRLVIVNADDTIQWQMPWGGIHDIHMLEDGHILTRKGRASVVEIDPESKQVVWEYDSTKQNGNQGKKDNPPPRIPRKTDQGRKINHHQESRGAQSKSKDPR